MLPAFDEFVTQVKAKFSQTPRDWRLITFVAAQHVASTYCSRVYGKMLLDDLGSKEKVLALPRDFRNAGLDERTQTSADVECTLRRRGGLDSRTQT